MGRDGEGPRGREREMDGKGGSEGQWVKRGEGRGRGGEDRIGDEIGERVTSS